MTGFDKGAEKLKLLCTVGENVKMAQLLWKTVWQVLKTLKNRIEMIQKFYF